MTDAASKQRPRFGLHVHVYLWVGVLLFSIALPLALSLLLFGTDGASTGFWSFVVLVAAFQALFQFACRRCASPDFGVWDGLLYVAAYMTVGVGFLSMLIAAPSVLIAMLASVGIALAAPVGANGALAPARYLSLVRWFGKHRMYQ